MTDGSVLELGKNAMMMTLLVSAPMLGIALVVGLLVSMFQAATQINEMTLSFVPKILAVFLVLGLFGPWMISNMLEYTSALFDAMATLATK
ncbi:MAG: flagellar biosynthesis protein FliQ [Chloroflexota bacterium]